MWGNPQLSAWLVRSCAFCAALTPWLTARTPPFGNPSSDSRFRWCRAVACRVCVLSAPSPCGLKGDASQLGGVCLVVSQYSRATTNRFPCATPCPKPLPRFWTPLSMPYSISEDKGHRTHICRLVHPSYRVLRFGLGRPALNIGMDVSAVSRRHLLGFQTSNQRCSVFVRGGDHGCLRGG